MSMRSGPYIPGAAAPYKLSRSKIDLYFSCQRCFYLDRRLQIGRPQGPPFTLNSAVDQLLKAEFDIDRKAKRQHALQKEFGIAAKPAPHAMLDKWRENFHGIQATHQPTNFLIFGALDDLWIDEDGHYIVVDYKATARAQKVTKLGEESWYDSYRRQIEVYQWLLRQNGLKVSDTGYFVYCTGQKNEPRFDAKLNFDIHVIPYTGSDKWIEPTLAKLKNVLEGEKLPPAAHDCDFCSYALKRLRMAQQFSR